MDGRRGYVLILLEEVITLTLTGRCLRRSPSAWSTQSISGLCDVEFSGAFGGIFEWYGAQDADAQGKERTRATGIQPGVLENG